MSWPSQPKAVAANPTPSRGSLTGAQSLTAAQGLTADELPDGLVVADDVGRVINPIVGAVYGLLVG